MDIRFFVGDVGGKNSEEIEAKLAGEKGLVRLSGFVEVRAITAVAVAVFVAVVEMYFVDLV